MTALANVCRAIRVPRLAWVIGPILEGKAGVWEARGGVH
jgi:hypothetical protein